MDASDLKVFSTVARHGSMNRAAVDLNMVQSNVTARIRALENEFGCQLFVRNSRGVSLTPAGQRLLPFAERMDRFVEEAHRIVADDGVPRGKLQIGSLETTVAIHLSPVLSDFVGRYREVDFILRTGTTQELVQSVLAKQLDGAFVCGPVRHAEIEELSIFREELVVLTASSVKSLSDLLLRGDVRIVVLRVGCSYRQRLEEILARRGITGLRRHEFGTFEAIFGCVAAGLGITLLPKRLLETISDERRFAVHELPKAEANVDTVYIRRHDMYQSSASLAFLDLVRPGRKNAIAAE